MTYHVYTHTITHKIILTYTDAKGLTQEIFVGKRWKKSVCLPPGQIASLRIDEIIDPEKDYRIYMYQQQELHDSIGKEFVTKPLSIWIEHEKKIVLNAGYRSLQVSLLASEIN